MNNMYFRLTGKNLTFFLNDGGVAEDGELNRARNDDNKSRLATK